MPIYQLAFRELDHPDPKKKYLVNFIWCKKVLSTNKILKFSRMVENDISVVYALQQVQSAVRKQNKKTIVQ